MKIRNLASSRNGAGENEIEKKKRSDIESRRKRLKKIILERRKKAAERKAKEISQHHESIRLAWKMRGVAINDRWPKMKKIWAK